MAADSLDFRQLITTAKHHLVYHDYRDAMQTCMCGLERLTNTLDLAALEIDKDTEESRFKVALGLLAIQALVLDKQGDNVGLFVEEWFGEVRAWPAEILQICVCHYLHIKENATAQTMTEEWLHDKHNQCQCDYEQIVEFYIKNVLLPGCMFEMAQEFLNSCQSITEEKKQNLLLYTEKRQDLLTNEEKVGDSSATVTSTYNTKAKQSNGSFSLLLSTIRLGLTTKQLLTSKTITTTLKAGARVVILVYFLYIIVARTDTPGDIFYRGTGPNILWAAVKRAWQALFAPYHMMPH